MPSAGASAPGQQATDLESKPYNAAEQPQSVPEQPRGAAEVPGTPASPGADEHSELVPDEHKHYSSRAPWLRAGVWQPTLSAVRACCTLPA